MHTGSRRFSWASVAMLVALSFMPLAAAWTPPPPEFVDVAPASGIDVAIPRWGPDLGAPTSLLDVLPAGSPAAADFNRDGFPDLFVPMTRYTDDALNAANQPRSRLFFNDGSGLQDERFVDVTDVSGIDVRGFAYAASWADYDNDGFPDLFVGGYRLARLYHNDADGTFTDVTAQAGLPQDGLVLGGAWGDYDNDGRVDLFLVQFTSYTHPDDGLPALGDLPGKANVLLRNLGGGAFADVSAGSGVADLARRSTSAAWVDFDRDGRLDVYVTSYGQDAEALRNNGDGTFTDMALLIGLQDGQDATCQAWEDLDRDGLLDLYVGHQDGVVDGTWLGQPDGRFKDISGQKGLHVTDAGDAWACLALDYDGDGDMDVAILHGGLRGVAQRATLVMNRLDEGLVDPPFVDITPEAGDRDLPGYEAYDTINTPLAWSGGGLLDWSLVGAPSIAAQPNPRASGGDVPDVERLRLVKNMGWVTWTGNGNYFKVKLEGQQSNRDGLGAVVTVQAGAITVTRQIGAAMAWGGQSLTETQFGLLKPDEAGYRGQARPVNVTIAWPSGQVDVYEGLFGVQKFVRFAEGGSWQNDTVAPRPTLQLTSGTQGSNGWFKGPVTLKVTAADRILGGSEAKGTRTLRYSLDGATWVQAANPSQGVQLSFSAPGTQRLWIETRDKAGDTPGWRDNVAVFLYPIRIDGAAPAVEVASPRPGGVYAQGREVARVAEASAGQRAALGTAGLQSQSLDAFVLAPVPVAAPPDSGPAGAAAAAALGSSGRQPVAASASDAGSGLWKVRFDLTRPDGAPVANGSATLRLAPFTWQWRAAETPAGVYVLTATAWDLAGNTKATEHRVVVAPTGQEGATQTVVQRPSLPRPTAGLSMADTWMDWIVPG